MTKEKENANPRWILPGVVLMIAGFIVIPPLIRKIGNRISKAASAAKNIDYDNLGPTIEKKEDTAEEETHEC